MAKPITTQTGLREYTGDLSQYSGMLSGLTPDVHTLRSLNPETTNRVRIFMYRGPYFLMHYLGMGDKNAYAGNNLFMTYKKMIECYNMGIQVNRGGGQLNPANLQGGFAGRNIAIPTTQTGSNNDTLTITVPELVGRPIANVNNLWVSGIADEVTCLTTYLGQVAGSIDSDGKTLRRVFAPAEGESAVALEPSPAYEVAEFLVVALDRSGARVEGAIACLGCYPQGRVGDDIFNHVPTGTSEIQRLTLTFNCQTVQSSYINDLASRIVAEQSIFGCAMNLNIGAGDAVFRDANSTVPDTNMFNLGKRPELDAVQSGIGNYPVFIADQQRVEREGLHNKTITPTDHSQLYLNPNETKDISNPYATAGEG